MAAATDILVGNDWDLQMANGDFLTGLSDVQHQALITIMGPGHLKENPFLGIGILNELGGNNSPSVIRVKCQQMYEADGYTVNSITVSPDYVVNVNAERLG